MESAIAVDESIQVSAKRLLLRRFTGGERPFPAPLSKFSQRMLATEFDAGFFVPSEFPEDSLGLGSVLSHSPSPYHLRPNQLS